MNPIELIYAIATATAFYVLFVRMKAAEARITRLETRQPVKPEPKAVEKPQPKQIWDKPVVPGAKEVKPLPIGGGKQVLDYETQVAEWI
jgi:hypothetical protein